MGTIAHLKRTQGKGFLRLLLVESRAEIRIERSHQIEEEGVEVATAEVRLGNGSLGQKIEN
jgi:hypothetical protein